MTESTPMHRAVNQELPLIAEPPGDPCIMVIFGASGDLTKRLLMPALYNLACDRLLPAQFAIVGMAMDTWTTEAFRERMSHDIREFSTRPEFDAAVWDGFVRNLYYTPGKFDDLGAYQTLARLVEQLDTQYQAQGNVLFYMATPPVVFGMISGNLDKAGFKRQERGWKRIIVEKPFGHDLQSAIALNQEILSYWTENQIYRIDHYLGKETVQNILAFRFSNGMFEPLWNKNYVDHIQFTVAETVGVEGRGNYYERSGVLRDMIQNHMFQMLAYVGMEPPTSFKADDIRNEKAKLLSAVRIMSPEAVRHDTARGQYGPGSKSDGSKAAGYREEKDVDPQSNTETFAAMRLFIDNWRWEGVPVYLRSGNSLWKKDTEIMVQFKKAPEVLFHDTPVDSLASNQLIFHIQPDQGIEVRFQAKRPGPSMSLQKVNMYFSYGEAFKAARGTGYETLIHDCMSGEATLFSRTDLVETAWRIAQPLLDSWANESASEFPNYPVGSWGPKSAFDLIERDGRKWLETLSPEVIEHIPLFGACDAVFLRSLTMTLEPVVYAPGDYIVRQGETGEEMYIVCRGEVDVVDEQGDVVTTLSEGGVFGEVSLLLSEARTASVRAKTHADLFVLKKSDFVKALKDYPHFAQGILQIAHDRYSIVLEADQLLNL